jgi:spermidine dehydrogenase
VRIRLNSTAVDVRHTPNEKNVDVTYVRDGETFRVRGRHVVLACDNKLIPYICSETPEEQVAAINYATKVPLVLGNVAIRNWRAFDKLGFQSFYSPGDVLFKLIQFDGMLGDGGFDAERDIAAITVNRWPHGYAYEYNDYDDPPEYNRYNGPHLKGCRADGPHFNRER